MLLVFFSGIYSDGALSIWVRSALDISPHGLWSFLLGFSDGVPRSWAGRFFFVVHFHTT